MKLIIMYEDTFNNYDLTFSIWAFHDSFFTYCSIWPLKSPHILTSHASTKIYIEQMEVCRNRIKYCCDEMESRTKDAMIMKIEREGGGEGERGEGEGRKRMRERGRERRGGERE